MDGQWVQCYVHTRGQTSDMAITSQGLDLAQSQAEDLWLAQPMRLSG